MSDEILTMLGVGATLLASGGSFALFIFRLFARLEDKVDSLARDHQSPLPRTVRISRRNARAPWRFACGERRGVSNEIVTMLGVGATLLASGGSFALFFFRLLVRLEGRIGGLEGRFDGLEGRIGALEGRFDVLEGRIGGLEGRFDVLEGRIGALEGRFDGLEGRIGGLEGRFDVLEGRIGALEGRFDGLEISFIRLENRFVRLEEKVDGLAKDYQTLARELSELRGEIRARLGDLPAGSPAQ